MELKMKYQFTYFIHPFIIKESKYQKYILKLLKDENVKLKIFEKNKDFQLYEYFLPKIKNFIFPNINNSISKLDKLPKETQAALLAKNPCISFSYKLQEDIQGKTKEQSIFFNVSKIDIICFNTGVCFLCFKTNLEDTEKFEDLLNFNYKFKEIKKENSIKISDNIYLQNNKFSSATKLNQFIIALTGSDLENIKYNIDENSFYMYAYACIDAENWNNSTEFDDIKENFNKYINFLPMMNNNTLNVQDESLLLDMKYAKLCTNKQGVALFTSAFEINNFTNLPDKYENEYLYTYIINLYKKIYLQKLEVEFKLGKKVKNIRKKFIEFTKNLWIFEITSDEIGSNINDRFFKVLDIEKAYYEVKMKYDILYKEMNIEKNFKTIILILIVLIVLLIFNVLNYFQILK